MSKGETTETQNSFSHWPERRLPDQMYRFNYSPFIKVCELYFALLIDIFGVLFCFLFSSHQEIKKKKAVILKSNYKWVNNHTFTQMEIYFCHSVF